MRITLDQLAPLTGKELIVKTSHGSVALSLVAVTELPRRGLPAQFATPLSLVLHGPSNIRLAQDNYYIDHPLFEGQPCCIVPIAPSATAAPPLPRYQIIFN
ncbi:hypothetical protein GTP38_10905 [Duganella sp. FT94W]|uniref:DUF6916 domain-containing protein n=1 Tax=Duganella lactea TaxID=2692173 RepID=A0ABW9V6A9_9BURK|nr:hypothetical protein [Duganella lactea]MYM34848.1 hypothetical protein [Duganella lactea]